jgi:peptide/nickel transport system substrate-binding protein
MKIGKSLRQKSVIAALSGVLLTSVGSPVGAASTQPRTVTFAEAPGANPNYIFPFISCAYDSVNNVNQFQDLMFRPLYWFGLGGSSSVVPSLSLAKPPVFTLGNKTVTISLKGWKFANGQSINAQSVMFFLNMYQANPTTYCGFTAGSGIPNQVKSAAGNGKSVKINFTTPVNPNWLLYNYLSEITPMPNSWDLKGARVRGGCATGKYGAPSTTAACIRVEHYLATEATKTSNFTGSMWQSGVDGPWRLTAFDGAGNATFQPNTRYSGPKKAMVKYVKEVAFTSAATEQNQLQNGALDIGYISPAALPSSAPQPGVAGANLASLAGKYNLNSGSFWNFNYALINFSPKDPKAAAIALLYIRQALQEAVDQRSVITAAYKGYGFPVDSPLPPNTPSAISAPVTNPYPYNLNAAKALLTSHGWTETNGLMTCTSPGTATNQCGAGITQGYTLNFKIVWTGGSSSLDTAFNLEIASWASIGIQFTKATDTFNNMISDCSGASGYEICSSGQGWTYAPGYLPTGEALFTPSGTYNVGTYNDPNMTSLINATTHGTTNLYTYAKYAAEQLPVLYQPQAGSAIEINKSLKSTIGFTPNPLGNFMPEYYHF